MKVSLQLANLYSSADLLSINQDELIHKIGTQLGAIEEIINIEDVYKGVLVAKIIKCHKHPNADSLNVCMIDDGKQAKDVERDEQGLVQVVCGAPNVKEGLTVAWIPPGSVVPSTVSKDPFVLGKRELRGIVSNGMLASASELAISDDHQGILQIEDNDNQQVVAGKTFADLYSLKDLIIDCENKMFTHRPDCFGILGVARELAGIAGLPFKSPDWYSPKAIIAYQDSGKLSIDSKNEIPEKVKRFMVQVVEDITVKPSTIQRQSWLTRLDNRPINNIVDATNFYMQLTAQPTHAFDYDKVKQLCADPARVCIFPRMAKDGETLELLNGKTIKLTTEDIVIATDKRPIALAGVMGGVATEVDSNTKNIIVECATFDMYTIRRTSMRHGLFTDAVTRFNKGQSHLQNAIVLSKLVDDICEQSDGTAGRLFDSLPEASLLSWSPVLVNINFINKRLGSSLSIEDISTLLTNVEFKIETNGDNIIVEPPFWRMDIQIAEDIVEEVGRLYGYDKITVSLPLRSSNPAKHNPMLDLHARLRNYLSKSGANEVLTYNFISQKLIQNANQDSRDAYQLANALSPELQYYRLSIIPNLASKVHQNIKAGYDKFAIFELGKSHVKGHGVQDDGLPIEIQTLGFVYSANDKKVTNDVGAAYFFAKRYLDYLANSLGLELDYALLTEDPVNEINRPFDWRRSALVTERNSGNYIGIVGELKSSVRKNLKLPQHTSGFEVLLDPVLESSRQVKSKSRYVPLAKFPRINQDLTLISPKELLVGDLVEVVIGLATSLSAEHRYIVNIDVRDIYHKQHSDKNHVTLRLNIYHKLRTLTTDEVNKFIDNLVKQASTKLPVKRDK